MVPANISTRILIFILFSLFGFLGNWLKISLFFNVDFLTGSVFSMLAILMLGSFWGITTAFIAGTYTYLIWNHPWAIIIFTAEAIAVSWLYARRKGNIVLYDLIYWVFLGIPLVYLFYYQVMGLSFQNALVIMLKQSINGVSNALLATIAFYLYTFLKRSRTVRTAYSDLLFSAMVTLAVLPIILLSISAIRKHQNDLMETFRSNISWVADSTQKNLIDWIGKHQGNVQILSTFIVRQLS